MPTGGSDLRIRWAQLSVSWFHQQTYENKHLLILNSHPTLHVVPPNGTSGDVKEKEANVIEIKVNRKYPHLTTLGDVRNFSLSLVPKDAFVYIWDDDDYHHPDLLRRLAERLSQTGKATVFLKNRINYNLATNALWLSSDKRGLVHFMADINKLRTEKFAYLSLNSAEDQPVHLISEKEVIDNNPSLYIRFTHHENTSLYVNKSQKGPIVNSGPYTESDILTVKSSNASHALHSSHASYLAYVRGVVAGIPQNIKDYQDASSRNIHIYWSSLFTSVVLMVLLCVFFAKKRKIFAVFGFFL